MKFYFVRHGESEGNKQGVCCGGGVDVPLTELGRQQALDASNKIHDLDVHTIYHSPMIRAHDTAKLLNTKRNLPMHVVHDLKEWYLGDWLGIGPEELKERAINKGLDPENGETRQAHFDRIFKAVNEILEMSSQPFIVVAHGGTFDAITKRFEVQHDITYIHNCMVVEFVCEGDQWHAFEVV